MAPTPSITIVKTFTYRGDPEEWSNTYHFNGADPASDASWKTLADNVIAAESLCLPDTCTIIRAVGHKAGVVVHDWSYDYAAHSEETVGQYVTGTTHPVLPGDCAAWIRWSTTQLTSKGKPIYLRSYFHAAIASGTKPNDALYTTWTDLLQAYGDAWVAGFDDGDSVTHLRAGPNGAVAQTALPSTYATTRTLERRGRRPPP